MNSAILRSALRGHIEHRITKELTRRLSIEMRRNNWEFARWLNEPTSVDLTDDSTVVVKALLKEPRYYEFRFDKDGDMRSREVTEWRWNP